MKASTILQSKMRIKKYLKVLAVAAFWLAIWQVVYMIVGTEILMVSPYDVVKRIITLAGTSYFWLTAASSLVRIAEGYILAVIAGTLMAVICSTVPFVKSISSPLLTIVKTTPVASFIILALVWVKTVNVPVLISFLMVLPSVWSNVSQGIRKTDRRLLEMAGVYRLGAAKKIKSIYIPSVMPYFMSAATTSLGFAWKAGIAAEVISTPKYSIGRELNNAKVYIETADLFAWTAVVIILSIILEKLFVKLVYSLNGKRRLNKYRLRRKHENDPVI